MDAPSRSAGTRRGRRNDPERRDRIIDACLDVLALHGVAGTSHRKVAAQAGVPLGAMTYYFDGMHELLHEAFTRFGTTISDRFEKRMAAAPDAPAARDAVVEIIRRADRGPHHPSRPGLSRPGSAGGRSRRPSCGPRPGFCRPELTCSAGLACPGRRSSRRGAGCLADPGDRMWRQRTRDRVRMEVASCAAAPTGVRATASEPLKRILEECHPCPSDFSPSSMTSWPLH